MARLARYSLVPLLLATIAAEASAQAVPNSDSVYSSERASVALLIAYSVLIVAASLLGGFLPTVIRLTHTRMQVLISLVGGLMLGIGVFHMLPHALVHLGPNRLDSAVIWLMVGMLVMFFLLRAFHFHQHGPADFQEGTPDCDHPDHHHHHNAHKHGHAHRYSWLGVFLGLALHTLIDGMALGASMEADRVNLGTFALFGLGTFVAILLHKPLDAVSITSLMTASGWSNTWKLVVNAAFASMCPLGAFLFVIGVQRYVDQQAYLIGCTLAFSAGVFICIALSDLLPEMEFHSHHRVRLSCALLLGIALAWGIRYLEPGHAHHQHGQGAYGEQASPSHGH